MRKLSSNLFFSFLYSISILVQTNAFCQSPGIDSVIVIPQIPTSNDSVTVKIFGTHASTADRIINITQSISNNELTINLYINAYYGGWALTPYDTIVPIGLLPSAFYTLKCFVTGDTLVLDTVHCYSADSVPQTFDSISITFNVTFIENVNQHFFIVISPNPFTHTATITFNQPGQFDFTLFNIFGKEVMRRENISGQSIIERGTLPAGIYFYRISNGNKIVDSGKVVIQ